MLRSRIVLKSFAVFFILEIIFSTVSPAISYALTSGPTAPEATSFEPVDTTDLVNTITGDFVYNVPLFEVPGPGGNYPLSLSYHAGIQPNVDASWVGLGWSLNPGSINRLSNGLPDDFDNTKSTNRIFWEGGLTTINTYGLSYGIGRFANVSMALSFANDTYRGRGTGQTMGISLGYQTKFARIGVSATAVSSPYGETYVSGGASLGVGFTQYGINASANVGLSINGAGKVSASMSAGVSAGIAGNSVGASISTDKPGISTNASVAGISSSFHNSKTGKTTTRETHFAIDIPVWYGVNIHLGRDTYRYFRDEKETYDNFGSLYYKDGPQTNMDTKMFDTYHVQSLPSLSFGENPAKSMEGSFPDYDSYNVNAQGLAGNFRPHHYTLSLYSQDIINREDNTKDVLGYYIPQHSKGVHYRFENDFSNRVINDPPNIEINKVYTTQNYPPGGIQNYEDWVNYSNGVYNTSEIVPLYFPFSSPTTGIEGYEEPGTKRYIPKVPGSKHIEYFTNQDIINSATNSGLKDTLAAKGFKECNAAGFTRPTGEVGKVGAFAITNESGVTYHFSLPAYSYDEYTYSQNKDHKDKTSFNMMEQKGKYAYTWYLTAITGPDYVDRGPSGNADYIVNEYDWGYWVDFQYGKWTDNYRWRNPAEGYNNDFDIRHETFSKGTKEVYYLNAIKTKTHTALFVKEIRADGKSVTVDNDGAVITNNSNPSVVWVDGGGFDVKRRSATVPISDENAFTIYDEVGAYYDFPVSSMKLNTVYLFDNVTLNQPNTNAIAATTTKYNHVFNYSFNYTYTSSSGSPQQRNFSKTINVHQGSNVIDIFDIAASSIPVAKALRKIDFNHTYDLAPGTANSFDPSGSLYECTNCANFVPNLTIPNTKQGKLTLNSVLFKGKNGVQTLPSMKFAYDLPDEPFKNSTISNIDSQEKVLTIQTGQQSDDFQIGDIVVFNQSSDKFYGFVSEVTSAIKVTCISPTLPLAGSITNLKRTKNPPYDKDKTDMWGYYKVDKVESRGALARYPTPISGKNVDAWSLRAIRTSLGSTIKVNYESDTYSESLYTSNLVLRITETPERTDVTPVNQASEASGAAKFFFRVNIPSNSGIDFSELYEVGSAVDMSAAFYGCEDGGPICSFQVVSGGVVQEVSPTSIRLRAYVPSLQGNVVFKGGVIQPGPRSLSYGGGLRVAALQMINPHNNTTSSTDYTYEFNDKSAGVTTYEPIAMENMEVAIDQYPSIQNIFLYQIYQRFYDILALGRDIPAPGVYYSKVKVGEKIIRPSGEIQIPGYSVYEFETFSKDMIGWETSSHTTVNSTGTFQSQPYNTIVSAKRAMKNFSLRMGSLKSVTLFDSNGNKLNETINHYLHDQQTDQSFSKNRTEYPVLLEKYRSQGVMHETFNHARWVKRGVGQLQGLISKKESYPVIKTGTTTINYKSGIVTKNETLEYDFYSGAPTKSVKSDGMNNYFVSESIPAYKFYPSMGFKMDHVPNKHMLTQNALNYVYKVDPANYQTKLGLVGATAQTWTDQINSVQPGILAASQQTGIWRIGATFTYIGDPNAVITGDGLSPINGNNLPAFDAWPYGTWANNAAEPAGWQKNSEITLYDVYSHALEGRDINGDYGTTKMSQNQESVYATVANSRYSESAFSGAEDVRSTAGYFGGNVAIANGSLKTRTSSTDKTTTHTGLKSLGLTSSSQKCFLYSFTAKKDRDYIASVWVNATSGRLFYSVNGVVTTAPGVPSSTVKAGAWYLVSVTIPKSATDVPVQVWCSTTGAACNFDDFRVHPYDAAMVSYVYNEFGELSHILDAKNLYTEYSYDEGGRLKQVNRETIQYGVIKASESTIHYGRND